MSGSGSSFPSTSRFLAATSVVLLLVGEASPARASIFSGSCPVQVDFAFDAKVRGLTSLSAPAYSVTINNYLGLPCAIAPEIAQPMRSTVGGGNGSSSIWTCEATLGQGSWSQSWGPGFPAVTSGSHVIAGAWGGWTMIVTSSSPNLVGIIKLTTDPADATKLAQCEQNGISNLSMIGTMTFQDP